MAMFGVRSGMTAGFTPQSHGLAGTAGLVGDILSDNNVTRSRLDADDAFAQQQYAAAHPAPMAVGDNVLQYDPTTGGIKTLFTAPPKAPALDAFGQAIKASGIDPASPQGQALYRQKVQNEVDPVHAYPTTDAAGNQGLVFKRPSEIGMPAAPMSAPAGVTFTPRASGGAAPAMGPGGFPLYRGGH